MPHWGMAYYFNEILQETKNPPLILTWGVAYYQKICKILPALHVIMRHSLLVLQLLEQNSIYPVVWSSFFSVMEILGLVPVLVFQIWPQKPRPDRTFKHYWHCHVWLSMAVCESQLVLPSFSVWRDHCKHSWPTCGSWWFLMHVQHQTHMQRDHRLWDRQPKVWPNGCIDGPCIVLVRPCLGLPIW
jgi:hypothetical protein